MGKLSRIILAFACFPLLGAYSLRWVGGAVADLAGMAQVSGGLLPLLDVGGAVIGVVLGLLLAVQVIGCSLQPEVSPVRPVGDNILIILALVLLLDVVLPRAVPGTVVVQWLPAVTLAVWSGAGAATMAVARMRHDLRSQMQRPQPPVVGPQY